MPAYKSQLPLGTLESLMKAGVRFGSAFACGPICIWAAHYARNALQGARAPVDAGQLQQKSQTELSSTAGATTSVAAAWHPPVPAEFFVVKRRDFLHPNKAYYPITGVHPGVDYGTKGRTDVDVFACAEGKVVYSRDASDPLGKIIGNHFVLYVPQVDRSFLYAHLATSPPAESSEPVLAGQPLGTVGQTGSAAHGIHLHFEGYFGRFITPAKSRKFATESDISRLCFDADKYIRSMLLTQ